MPEIGEILSDEEFKSKAAAVGAGILVIIAGFLVYNYFSRVGKEAGVVEEEAAIEEMEEAGEAGEIEEAAPGEEIAETEEPEEKEEPKEVVGVWTANNYNPGDINGGSYTVKGGDTLWEIAEARYGSGFDWTKILEANKDSVGFLPNGQQSLIHPGQTLVLP